MVQELCIQQRCYRNLILRNRDLPLEVVQKAAGDGAEGGNGPTPLVLPFIIIQAKAEARVELQMSDDSTQVQFDFHQCVLLPLHRPNPAHDIGPNCSSAARGRDLHVDCVPG